VIREIILRDFWGEIDATAKLGGVGSQGGAASRNLTGCLLRIPGPRESAMVVV
jgi:hypothetical protein